MFDEKTETTMTQDEMKKAVARAAITYVVEGELVGVGTGSTNRATRFGVSVSRRRQRRLQGPPHPHMAGREPQPQRA